jgi:protein involved in polysaccharide export with SLBB domain
MRYLLLAILSLALLLPRHSHAQAVLRNGDIFELTLSGMPVEYAQEFHLSLTVGDDGEVRIPLIGGIKASGTSTTQVARAIERKLVAEKIFTNPTAVINLQPQSRFVTVGGAVRAPQAVPWNNDMTLSNAITRAGDFSDFANHKKIKVTREGKVSYYNLKNSEKDPTQNPKLLPADEVTVSE